jgi:hypothetical protein
MHHFYMHGFGAHFPVSFLILAAVVVLLARTVRS